MENYRSKLDQSEGQISLVIYKEFMGERKTLSVFKFYDVQSYSKNLKKFIKKMLKNKSYSCEIEIEHNNMLLEYYSEKKILTISCQNEKIMMLSEFVVNQELKDNFKEFYSLIKS